MNTQCTAFAEALQSTANAWVGTPFAWLHNRCGIGVDCSNLVYAVLQESGADLPDLGAPTFGVDTDTNYRAAVVDVLTLLVVSGHMRVLAASEATQAGDVLLMRAPSLRTQHMALALGDGDMLQAWPSHGVEIVAVAAPERARLINRYRLTNV